MGRKSGVIPKSINAEALRTSRIKKFENATKKEDTCDCGSMECPGCWEDCEKCSSNKCSHFCRVGRKYPIEWKKSD